MRWRGPLVSSNPIFRVAASSRSNRLVVHSEESADRDGVILFSVNSGDILSAIDFGDRAITAQLNHSPGRWHSVGGLFNQRTSPPATIYTSIAAPTSSISAGVLALADNA